MAESADEFPNGYSKTYLKTINNQLTCIINYAKRFYALNTNPCGQAGSMGQAKAEEMDYWTYEEYLAFREGIKDKPLAYICFQVLYWSGMREGELLALSLADIDLAANVPNTPPELPAGNPLLDAAGIVYDTRDYDISTDAASITVPAGQMSYGPSPLPKETASGKVIPMPQRKVI